MQVRHILAERPFGKLIFFNRVIVNIKTISVQQVNRLSVEQYLLGLTSSKRKNLTFNFYFISLQNFQLQRHF